MGLHLLTLTEGHKIYPPAYKKMAKETMYLVLVDGQTWHGN